MIIKKSFTIFKDRSFSRAGFTLIEIIISIGILSGIIFMVSMFSLDVFNFQIFFSDVFIAQQEISLTLTEMGVQVRSIGPSDNGSYPIESASSTAIVFYSDINGDNAFERVRYFVSGNILRRGVIEPTGNPATYPLAGESTRDVVSNIILPPTASQSLFLYYDKNYTGAQAPMSEPIDVNQVRLIKATITTDKTPQNIQGRVDYFSTMMIRNLRNVQ